MRLVNILLESSRTTHLKSKYPQLNPTIIDEIEAIDPSRGKSIEWIIHQLIKKIIRWPEDKNRINQALTTYYQIKKSPRLLKQYNISSHLFNHTIQDLELLDDKVRGIIEKPESLADIPQDVEKIYDDGVYAAIKPLTAKATCALAKGTKWCTSDIKTAKEYISKGNGLIIFYKNGKKIAQGDNNHQLMDLRDRPIISDKDLIIIYFKLTKMIPADLVVRIPEIESYIIKDTRSAYYYARDVIKGRWPEAEPYIMKNPEWAYHYTHEVCPVSLLRPQQR